MKNLIVLCLLLIPSLLLAQPLPGPRTAERSKPEKSSDDYPLDLNKAGISLPIVEDPQLKTIFDNRNTIFYKLPQVWQHWIPSSRIERNNLTLGEKSYTNTPYVWGIYFSGFLPDFNANNLFPWETTIGLNTSHKESTAYKTINFVSLPEQNGKIIPILVLNELPLKWIYPPGTTLGEIIYVVHENRNYVQEIRIRTKSMDSTTWEPAVHRPIKDRDEFIRLTKMQYTPAYKFMHFRNPQEDEVHKMEGLVERLPPLNDAWVKFLLNRPFKKLTDSEVWSPAADQEFHVLPKSYCFALLGSVDSHTCTSCHKQTQASHRHMIPKEPLIINNPEKVGNVRGSDTGFTWHPFDLDCVRNSDKEPEKQVKFRAYDLKIGAIKYSRNDETEQIYKLTQFVQSALKSYELPNKKYLIENEE